MRGEFTWELEEEDGLVVGLGMVGTRAGLVDDIEAALLRVGCPKSCVRRSVLKTDPKNLDQRDGMILTCYTERREGSIWQQLKMWVCLSKWKE